MIDLNNLIDFFPFYFKENDSYKVDGKGLLERFLNICGEYLQEYPLADLDSFLENLDINKTNEVYVQNFWKFFGELPFAGGPIIDGELFSNTFTGFNFDEALKVATKPYPEYAWDENVDYRPVLRYALSLFKIRGTKRFFEVMFRLYGLTVTITEESDSGPFEENHIPRYDFEYILFDKAFFDEYYRCKECSDVTFSFRMGYLPEAIKESFTNQVTSFISRFVPFYVNPIIFIT